MAGGTFRTACAKWVSEAEGPVSGLWMRSVQETHTAVPETQAAGTDWPNFP